MNKYLYISKLLPFINANKDFFLGTIAPNPKNLHYFISEDAPKRLCKIFNDEFQPVPVKNITGDIRENSPYVVLFVEFDDSFVTEVTDCYAIAIAISPKNEIRFFTYEKGESFIDHSTKYYVGEFIEDGSHKNYGTTREYGVSFFSGVIMEELNK